MDLLEAYDCLPHDLIVPKLEAYDLAKESLQLISDYLSFRKQSRKIGSAYSDWASVIRGTPEGSTLRSLFFNIFINDIFLVVEKSDICQKVIYQSDAFYDDLLQLRNSVSLHQLNLRFLLTEIYKSTGTLNPRFMWSCFKYREVPYIT